VTFVTAADGTYSAYVGNSADPALGLLCAENLTVDAWHSFVLNFDKFVDSDNDGLDDEWEMLHFGNLSQDGSGDFDGDGISNLQEFLDQTDPTAANAKITFTNLSSSLGRGAGAVEIGVELTQASTTPVNAVVKIAKATAKKGIDFNISDPQLLTFNPGETSKSISITILSGAVNAEQPEVFVALGLLRQKGANLGAIPKHTVYIAEGEGVDTDNDGLPDWWEMKYFGNLNQTAEGDPDADSLSNMQEYLLGSNPNAGRTIDTNNNNVKLNLFAPVR